MDISSVCSNNNMNSEGLKNTKSPQIIPALTPITPSARKSSYTIKQHWNDSLTKVKLRVNDKEERQSSSGKN